MEFQNQCMSAPKFLLEPVKGVIEACRTLSSAPIALGDAGCSIYPHTALAAVAVEEGMVLPEDDLLAPTFCMTRSMQDWMEQMVSRWLERKPNWHS